MKAYYLKNRTHNSILLPCEREMHNLGKSYIIELRQVRQLHGLEEKGWAKFRSGPFLIQKNDFVVIKIKRAMVVGLLFERPSLPSPTQDYCSSDNIISRISSSRNANTVMANHYSQSIHF